MVRSWCEYRGAAGAGGVRVGPNLAHSSTQHHGAFGGEGANFTAAMGFEIASTNLVVELGIIMALVLGGRSPPVSSSAAR
jgi:hypothetical protein